MSESICPVCSGRLSYAETHDPSNEGVCDACQAEIASARAARVRTQRSSELLSAETQVFLSPVSSETRSPGSSSGSSG